MLIEYALIAGFGVLIAVCGFLAWKKNLLWMVVNQNFNKVSSDNISPYCREQGIGMIVVGISIILFAGINYFTDTSWGIPVLVVGIIAFGLIGIHAYKQYNH